MADSLRDKARQAQIDAGKVSTNFAASDTVYRNAKTAKVNLTMGEEAAAEKAIKGNMKAERERTASRAEYIANREEAKSKQARIQAATGSQPGHHVTSVDRKTGKAK